MATPPESVRTEIGQIPAIEGLPKGINLFSLHAADGTPLAAEKLARVLSNDPGMGVIRHVDAGYDIADRVARYVRITVKGGGEVRSLRVLG